MLKELTPQRSPPDRVRKAELFASLPPEWPEDVAPAIRRFLSRSREKVVVLDDDPTGTQAIHNVPMLTEWPVESLCREFMTEGNCFFILTNTRSLPPAEARAVNHSIATNLAAASQRTGRRFVVVSRSDSTLRGYFPLETDALNEILGPFDGVLLVPFFETGGRHTINNVHYLAEGDWLVPVAQTQFARDTTFGYFNSNLPAWVEEKTAGCVRADQVASISVEDIRRGGPERVRELLMPLSAGRVCVVNLVTGRDLLVFVCGLLEAEAAGKRFLYRTAAPFPAARAGIAPRPVLARSELEIPQTGGALVAVGSYIPSSSEQLQRLIETGSTVNVEINARAVLTQESRAAEITRAAEAVNAALRQNRNTVLYTSRSLVTGDDPSESLSICRRVSAALVEVLQRVAERPRFVLSKGGITSSDVATKALGVRRAMVLGQILPGVPLLRLGEESRWPGMIYVTFPGNLGGPTALKDAVEKLCG